ncbi:MAG: ATP-binding protein, partial [Candidatus Eisenbacteria bacterium]
MTTSGPPLRPPEGTTEPRFTSVQRRITLLLAVTAVAFVGLLLLVQHGWRRHVDLLLRERVSETDRVLQRILDLRASGARVHADDYTRWDDFVTFAHQVDPRWGEINLTQSIATFGVDVAWVLNDQFDLVFTANPSNDAALGPLPIPAPTLVTALRARPIDHFFARMPGGLLEMWTSPIQPSDDFARKTPINGYYLIGRLWTATRVKDLARVANARVNILLSPDRLPEPSVSAGSGLVTIAVPLQGIGGSPVASVVFETVYPLVSGVYETLRLSAFLIVAGVVCIIVAVGWALAHWVGRPLATITEALRQQEPGLLRGSAARRDELGRLAGLVEDFFAQRQKLIEAREAADVAVQSKSQFLANISHELRTPLHGILSYSRFGLREATTAGREVLLEDFRNIEECGASLLALLDDLLDLAKFEAGRMKFNIDEILLEEVVATAVEEFASVYDEGALRAEVRADVPLAPVYADRGKLLQVLRNLLSNAGKFSKPGGTVTIHLKTSGPLARVVVEDSGVGIPESELESIFDKFIQASHTHTGSGGTGLVLAICREIV